MDVIISPFAKKQLKKLPKLIQFSVAKKVRNLSLGIETSNTMSLTSYKNIYRIRIGDYRMVYRVVDKSIYIILISHRREVYLLLKRMAS